MVQTTTLQRTVRYNELGVFEAVTKRRNYSGYFPLARESERSSQYRFTLGIGQRSCTGKRKSHGQIHEQNSHGIFSRSLSEIVQDCRKLSKSSSDFSSRGSSIAGGERLGRDQGHPTTVCR